jgi:hypothetical protein
MTAKSLIVSAAAALAAATLVAAHGAAQDRHVYISVTDKDGAALTGLTPADLTVREDGAAREVLGIEPAADPLQIELLVDDSQATRPMILEVRDALKGFVTAIHAANGASEIALMSFGDRPTPLVPFTNTPLALTKGIDQIFGRPGAGATFMQAIGDASQALKKRGATRPVIVAFVDEDAPEYSDLTHDQVETALKQAGASLWVVIKQGSVSNAQRQSAENQDNERERRFVLDKTTPDSGGQRTVVLSQIGLTAVFTRLASTLTHEFKLTYARPDAMIPPKRLEVTLGESRKGATLSAPVWAGQ